MTDVEKDRFLNGFYTLVNNGTYGKLVEHHTNMSYNMHSSMSHSSHGFPLMGQQRFLPWHRAYLLEFEEMLQDYDQSLFVPYWDWSVDRELPTWLLGITPTIIVNNTPITVSRYPGIHSDSRNSLPSNDQISMLRDETNYTDFTIALETGRPVDKYFTNMHNGVHVWIGGIMQDIQNSPSDILFWLHHANCDRIWSMWQQDHQDQGPVLEGEHAVLYPWTYNVEDVNQTSNLGYIYE